MTSENVIELAQRADFWLPSALPSDWDKGDYICSPTELKRFAELVRNETLEEAAKRCEKYAEEVNASTDASLYTIIYARGGTHCAAEIRSLKS
jgi:uncharacterized protein YeaO (DUF488 family)